MNERILLVDDEKPILALYNAMLKTKYQLNLANSAKEAIIILKENKPESFSVIISDYNMPEMNGVEFLTEAKRISPATVRIMLTANVEIKTAIEALEKGNIFRFLTKPCNAEVLLKTVEDAIEQHNLIIAEKVLLEKTLLGTFGIAMEILSIVNPEAFSQTLRMRNLSKKLISRLDLKNSWEIEIGVLLSQIGCVAVPPDILVKRFQGRNLSESETNLFYSHPHSGYKFISKVPRLEKIAENIKNQFSNFSPTENGSEIIKDFIKVLIDYDTLIQLGKIPQQTIEIMYKKIENYNPKVFQALEAEIMKVMQGFVIKSIKVSDLQVGMVLADDIRSERNVILMRKDSEISEVMLEKVLSFCHFEPVSEPIKILESV